MEWVYCVFLSASEKTPPSFCIGAYADKEDAKKKADEMNKRMKEQGYQKGFYRVQDVRFHDEEISEDDF